MSAQNREFHGQVVRCLPDLDSKTKQLYIDNSALLRRVLNKALTGFGFYTWKTVKLGTYRNQNALLADLKAKSFRVSDWAMNIVRQSSFTLSDKGKEIDLVVVSVAELGFKGVAEYYKIMKRAKELGLGLCPAEVGPQLRLAYEDQPIGELLTVAMEPITISDSPPALLCVGYNDVGQWLDADFGRSGDFWLSDRQLVFVHRK